MSVNWLGIPTLITQLDRNKVDEFLLQDGPDDFIFDIGVGESQVVIFAYLKVNGEKCFVNRYSPYDIDNFVADRNNIYKRDGKEPIDRVYEGISVR